MEQHSRVRRPLRMRIFVQLEKDGLFKFQRSVYYQLDNATTDGRVHRMYNEHQFRCLHLTTTCPSSFLSWLSDSEFPGLQCKVYEQFRWSAFSHCVIAPSFARISDSRPLARKGYFLHVSHRGSYLLRTIDIFPIQETRPELAGAQFRYLESHCV